MTRDQIKQLEDDLWSAADNLRANSDLKASEYGTPVLGLIFLKFADINYRRHEEAIQAEYEKLKGGRLEKPIQEIAVAKCGFYLPVHARYSYLLNLPEDQDIAKAIETAMESIEKFKPELQGSLPKDEYYRLTRTEQMKHLPFDLLRQFDNIPDDATGDIFGQIYEYFLGKFALAEGQGGGEFFTPRSVVRLMVEIIEPHGGSVLDPACGSGGMFVQSAQFIEAHRKENEAKGADTSVYVSGQEKESETVKLARMNLAVNGLRGEIKQGITYYEDHHDSFGKFDYVLANPPFNVDDVSLSSVEGDKRFNTYGIPRNKTKAKKSEQGKETVPNANYLWINLFATSLKNPSKDSAGGRAALVMANSASDARNSEADIRQTLIENNLIYGMLSMPSNMFYTVTLPATLWFFDKGKTDDRILFIDARNIFTQIDRAHREFSTAQVHNIAMISRLHKGRRQEFVELVNRYFEFGMIRLLENATKVEPVSAQLLEVLDDAEGKEAAKSLVKQWKGLDKLQARYEQYQASRADLATVDAENKAQHDLRQSFDPFFEGLHQGLKQLDRIVRAHEKQQADASKAEGKRGNADRKTKALKASLEELHAAVKHTEKFYQDIHWLQERFPEAKYEDVTGLCKLADLDEIKEQDYSLNPGRYVGVVIEEDGKAEEEFIDEIMSMNVQLDDLFNTAEKLHKIVASNLTAISGDN
jgi:type I restriction enzyme M protein